MEINNMIGIFDIPKTVFYISYLVGQFIVNCILGTANLIVNLIGNAVLVSRIIAEDFIIFLQDFMHRIHCIAECLVVTVLYIATTITQIADNIVFLLTTLYSAIVNAIYVAVNLLGNLFWGLKKLLVLFGDGVWFLVTIIPLSIVYLTSMSLYYIGSVVQEMWNIVLIKIGSIYELIVNTYKFIADVPVESAAGLIFAICIFYIFYQFYSTLKSLFGRRIYLIWCYMYTQYIGIKMKIKLKQDSNRDEGYYRLPSDLCIVCGERNKCILTLPCRHVCMCRECEQQLQKFRGTCPICRSRIDSSMRIFV